MTTTIRIIFGACALCLAGAVFAQEDEEPTIFTYATYFYCEADGQDDADEVMKERDGPVLDGLVDDGTIMSWGWLAHHTGGKWRRIRYFQADSIDGVLDGLDAYGEAVEALDDEESDEKFADACDAHDDYIWQVENGTLGKTRGKTGFSVYHVCDVAREERADEIVDEHFAPIFNKLVEDGKLASWGWSSHVVGGKYRKLQTMTAADPKALMAARTESIELLYGQGEEVSEAGREFTEICGPHSDYIWNIAMESAR